MKNDIIQTYQINNEKSFLIDDPAAYKIDDTQDTSITFHFLVNNGLGWIIINYCRAFAVVVVVIRCENVKNGRKPAHPAGKIQQDALRKVNRVKEIRRKEKEGLKITDNIIMSGRQK